MLKTRETARVIVRDDARRVLLIQMANPRDLTRYSWWLPGGGVHPGENPAAAAVREVREETGLELAELTHTADHELWMSWDGRDWLQLETIFTATVDRTGQARPTRFERATHLAHRWWNRADLAATTELVLPRRLLDVLDHRDSPLQLRDHSFKRVTEAGRPGAASRTRSC